MLGKALGAKIIIKNMAAAGGMEGLNYLATKAKPNGFTIGLRDSASCYLNQLMKTPGAQWDVSTLRSLGIIQPTTMVFYVTPDGPIKNIDDLKKAKGLKFASPSPRGWMTNVLVGVSELLGTALMLPLISGMEPLTALPFLLALHAVSYTGGSMTAILVNIPGTGPNAATLIDGFPMTLKGEAGRAMGAAICSSSMGGIISVFLALLFIPLVIPLVKLLFSAEMFFIVILGLSFLAVLAGSSPLKGLISGGLGLLVSFVGFQSTTGIPSPGILWGAYSSLTVSVL